MPITGTMLEVWIIITLSIFGLALLGGILSKVCAKKVTPESSQEYLLEEWK